MVLSIHRSVGPSVCNAVIKWPETGGCSACKDEDASNVCHTDLFFSLSFDCQCPMISDNANVVENYGFNPKNVCVNPILMVPSIINTSR